jgi:hypothetical protein
MTWFLFYIGFSLSSISFSQEKCSDTLQSSAQNVTGPNRDILVRSELNQHTAWTKKLEDWESQKQSWMACCTTDLQADMVSYRLLVHSIDSSVELNEIVQKALNPTNRLLSLSFISENVNETFFGQSVGFIFHVPPENIVATADHDFASGRDVSDAVEYFLRHGLLNPDALLSVTTKNTWNEVLVLEESRVSSGFSHIRASGIFVIKNRSTNDELIFAQKLSQMTSLPIIQLH